MALLISSSLHTACFDFTTAQIEEKSQPPFNKFFFFFFFFFFVVVVVARCSLIKEKS
jgi:hypothetical protein